MFASLFPKNVRDRLFQQEDEGKDKKVVKAKNPLQTFMHDGSKPKETAAYDMLSGLEDRPIADLFLDCSVLFADIAGFTAWSSVRDPAQVFTLLETVYATFDALAARRKVFKVETIGDCYVAVTGLPNPQPDHAVRMVRFARDCLTRMVIVLADLVETLGEDTLDLNFRVGLHSGPVTAGVLRGGTFRNKIVDKRSILAMQPPLFLFSCCLGLVRH